MHDKKVEELLLATLAADSYSLGSHWVYDANELENLEIDWEGLNAPSVAWHEGKTKGDFTHYGDQIYILNEYLKAETHFDVKKYMSHWRSEMQTFKGYMDGSIKETIVNIDNNLAVPCGSNSGDMSILGRIVPLLKVSRTNDEFIENTRLLAQATHNNENVLEAMHFFSSLLLEVLDGRSIQESILNLKGMYSQNIQDFIEQGINSKENDTFTSISTFGSACPVEFSFPSTIHILFKYDDYKEALVQNAKAGGDSSARAMIIAYLMTAQHSIEIVPQSWLAFNTK
jgi:ADP-ribosylglycohydrolase